jgi:hypothetical protein
MEIWTVQSEEDMIGENSNGEHRVSILTLRLVARVSARRCLSLFYVVRDWFNRGLGYQRGASLRTPSLPNGSPLL